MIITLLFSALLVIILWPYFALINVFDFKRNPGEMEKKIDGRPARRTILRKNTDVAKAISGIVVAQFILNCAFYLTPELRSFLSNFALVSMVVIAAGLALYIMTPANRMAHAYMTMGQILIIHVVSGLSIFYVLSAVAYGNYLDWADVVKISVFIIGAMIMFSGQPRRGI